MATIEWKPDQFGSCQLWLVRDGARERLYSGWGITETGSEAVSLVYYERDGDFVRVLEHQRPPGFWVRIADIPGATLHPWAEILTKYPRDYRGYDGLGLHSEPSGDSPILVTLRDRKLNNPEVHRLVPISTGSGGWAQFEVVEYVDDFDSYSPNEGRATGRSWRGWIRLVDDAGAPRLWFYARD